MNVLLSSLIKRRWPERAGFLIGMYITALSAGAIVASVVSVPLWQDTGGSVALTLGWLAAPAALAAVLWLPQVRSRSTPGLPNEFGQLRPAVLPGTPRAPVRPARVAVYRYALTWHVTLFMGMQSLLYYAALSWLPTMLRDRGESAAGAGDLLALMGVGNLAVSLFIPMAAQRMRSQVTLVVPTVIAVVGGLAALLYAPLGGAVAWALLLGAGQNAALALAIFFTAARAPHAAAAASLSSSPRRSATCSPARPPRGRAAALGDGQLDRAGYGAVRPQRRAARLGYPRRPPANAARRVCKSKRRKRKGSRDSSPPVGFDLDMTLIDSRRAILESFAAVAADSGVAIDPAGVTSRLGIKLEASSRTGSRRRDRGRHAGLPRALPPAARPPDKRAARSGRGPRGGARGRRQGRGDHRQVRADGAAEPGGRRDWGPTSCSQTPTARRRRR